MLDNQKYNKYKSKYVDLKNNYLDLKNKFVKKQDGGMIEVAVTETSVTQCSPENDMINKKLIEEMNILEYLKSLYKITYQELKTAQELINVSTYTFSIAAVDLDKTFYPSQYIEHKQTDKVIETRFNNIYKNNILEQRQFQEKGGIVIPITGNNLLMAKQKFISAKRLCDLTTDSDSDWNLDRNYGIYNNGAYIINHDGNLISDDANHKMTYFLNENVTEFPNKILLNSISTKFYINFLNYFLHNSNYKFNFGLLFYTTHKLYTVKLDINTFKDTGNTNDSNIQAMIITAEKNRIHFLEHLQVITVVTECDTYENLFKLLNLDSNITQISIITASSESLKDELFKDFNKSSLHNFNDTYKISSLKAPVDELFITHKDVDKGKTLKNFINYLNRKLKVTDETAADSKLDISTDVAVFGDTVNDEPLFKIKNDKGVHPAVRVAMPHGDTGDNAIHSLANIHTMQVYQVLQQCINPSKSKLIQKLREELHS